MWLLTSECMVGSTLVTISSRDVAIASMRLSFLLTDFLVCFSSCFGSVTITRARIEVSIPRKHGPAIAGYESVCVTIQLPLQAIF